MLYFERVGFSCVPKYPVIRHFDLIAPSGKKVSLVGSAGSGKTTVLFSDTIRNNFPQGAVQTTDAKQRSVIVNNESALPLVIFANHFETAPFCGAAEARDFCQSSCIFLRFCV